MREYTPEEIQEFKRQKTERDKKATYELAKRIAKENNLTIVSWECWSDEKEEWIIKPEEEYQNRTYPVAWATVAENEQGIAAIRVFPTCGSIWQESYLKAYFETGAKGSRKKSIPVKYRHN